jgi:hypothetical protein
VVQSHVPKKITLILSIKLSKSAHCRYLILAVSDVASQ